MGWQKSNEGTSSENSEIIAGMHFFVLIPVIGLAIAACILFIKGGVDIVHFIWELITGMTETYPEENLIVELVETVHLFLVGTVLFLTSLGSTSCSSSRFLCRDG